MPEIEIRPAVLADLSYLTAIDHSYQTDYVWQMDRQLEDGQVSVHFREIRLPRPVKVEYPRMPDLVSPTTGQTSSLLVGLLKDRLVGYVQIRELPGPMTAWVSDMAVASNVRRQGIGSALLLAAQDWAIHRSLRRIEVEMQSKNNPAIRLVKRLGYEFCGFNDQYYINGDIAVFFVRFLR